MTELTFSFFRNYEKYTGGHQKFYDYIEHTKALPSAQCELFVQNDCSVMPGFFNNITGVKYQASYNPNACNIVFLAGMDWQYYLPHARRDDVIVNLVQHVRHGDNTHPLFNFLPHKAFRICVSDAVRDAVTPYANGICRTIPIGHTIPHLTHEKEYDLYILAKKNVKFGRTIAKWTEHVGLKYLLHDYLVNKDEVLSSMAKAKVSLVLPNPTEGFFLPGIEAMALSERAVVPDAIANREYCKLGTNALLCEYNVEAVTLAVKTSLDRLKTTYHQYEKLAGEKLARSYSLTQEREIYHQLITEHVIPLATQ